MNKHPDCPFCECRENTECIVSACPNSKDQGNFIGDLCAPCYAVLTQTGWNKDSMMRVVESVTGSVSSILRIANSERGKP